jgi:hypothetical protein
LGDVLFEAWLNWAKFCDNQFESVLSFKSSQNDTEQINNTKRVCVGTTRYELLFTSFEMGSKGKYSTILSTSVLVVIDL